MDPLSKWFLLGQPDGAVDKICQVDGEWQLPHATGELSVIRWHVVMSGTVCVETPVGHQATVNAPALVLLPHNVAHRLTHQEEGRAFIVCGRLRLPATASVILTALPERMIIETSGENAEAKWLAAATELMLDVSDSPSPGSDAILSQQCATLLTLSVRHWLKDNRYGGEQGIFNALLHPLLGQAIIKMMESPAYSWTVESLANTLHMSRTRFAVLFRKETATSPVAVLTGIRMQIAAQQLTHGNLPIIKIAESIGYANESSFHKAFVRYFSCTPCEYRNNASALQNKL